MCGRFAVTLPQDAMAQLFAARPVNDLPAVPNYNVCPTKDVHAVTSDGAGRQLGSMRWGFLPHWYKTPNDGPLLINARAETIAEKPAFRAAARERRCLIPASGFYEWTKDADGNRLPWFVHPARGETLAFAGVYQSWDKGDAPLTTCAIVTTGANEPMSKIHHRMPVILAEKDWPLWLGEAGHGAATLMTAAPDDALDFYRVDPKVNSNRASGPDLIDPLDD
ncbi:SOS response-associated peptidase [Roseovarius atlanticus]|uniref:SOS response-associated peptidase n=1 Tax=Roseovarius atlanticus TaxID=1641875 RepID=UPI001C96A12C|nr:SOS response-associated peptidase [Roseovarius atlanticus]MBY5987663.1 SOS response-associated peptidase [Roseovarius atlanticus]MBY6123054.1 SOS response-associated peptidase [Roseovarius atlanticus]MBY6147550.1 SOS response-associated peptidase [Roseovarius atlanticus]